MATPTDATASPAPTGEIDLRGAWRTLVARRNAIIWPTLALTAAAIVFVQVTTPRYAGESRVLLESRASYLNRADRGERDQPTTNAFDAEGVQSQVQVVTSNDLAREAIKRLNLIGNPEFDPSASFSVTGRLMALLGLSSDLTERSVEDRVMKSYYERLSVYPVGKSRVVGIEFTSSDPQLAARAADTVADLYLDAVAAAKKDNARSAGAWLSGNIDELRNRVRDAEAKVEAFRGRNGLFAAGRDTTLPQQQLAEASTQLTQARTQQADAQAKAQSIREMMRSGRIFELTEVSSNELIRRLIEQRVTLRAQLALEARTLAQGHPRMKELNAQLADVEQQIRSAAERTVRGIENDVRVAAARVAQLTQTLEEQKARAAGMAENDVQLRALEREARTLREQLESYLAKYREAIARDTDNAEPPDARIISRAVVPSRPAFPRKGPIVLLTAFASLVVFAALAIVRELMGAGMRAEGARVVSPRTERQAARPDEVPVAAQPPASAPAPMGESMPEPIRAAAPDLPAAPLDLEPAVAANESARPVAAAVAMAPTVRALIDRLALDQAPDGARIVAVIGADRVDAGAFVADLARACSVSGGAILVTLSEAIAPGADADAFGFLDLLRGEASFAEAIRREQDSALHVMGYGYGDIAELAADRDDVVHVLDSLAGAYDAVIVDLPFDLTEAERAAFVGKAAQTVLLARGDAPDDATSVLFATIFADTGRDPLVVLLDADADEVRSAA